MEDKISLNHLNKYFSITEEAFEIVKKKVVSGKEKYAQEIFEMVGNYVSDAKHFKKQGNFVNAFAALNYAHGWIDSGVRLGVFDVKDNRLFTIK